MVNRQATWASLDGPSRMALNTVPLVLAPVQAPDVGLVASVMVGGCLERMLTKTLKLRAVLSSKYVIAYTRPRLKGMCRPYKVSPYSMNAIPTLCLFQLS